LSRASDEQASFHSAGEFVQVAGRPGAQPHEFQEIRRPAPGLGPREIEVPREDHEVLPGCQIRVQVLFLRDDAEPAFDRGRIVVHAAAQDDQLPRGDRDDRVDHPDRGRLPGAVGAEEAEAFPGPHLEVDPVHGDEGPKALGQLACTNRRFHGGEHRQRQGQR